MNGKKIFALPLKQFTFFKQNKGSIKTIHKNHGDEYRKNGNFRTRDSAEVLDVKALQRRILEKLPQNIRSNLLCLQLGGLCNDRRVAKTKVGSTFNSKIQPVQHSIKRYWNQGH
jgi:hypothetical protein